MFNYSSCQISGTVIFIAGYSAILILGLFFNIAALYFFFRLPQLQSPTTVYMKNLAFSDLLLVCTLPLRIYDYTVSDPAGRGYSVPQWLCDAVGTLLLLNMYGSIFLLACISLDRCLAVCFPLRSKRIRRWAPWICVAVWCLNMGSSVMAYSISSNGFQKNTTNKQCFHGQPPFVTMIGPTVGALVIGFLVPFIIMSVSSWTLLRAIGRSQLVEIGLVNKEKIVRMLATNLAIFLVCFLPYHTVLVLYQLWKANHCLHEVYKITLLVACSNAVLDPLTYYFVAETLKKTLIKEIKLIGESDNSAEKMKGSVAHGSG
ncbi:lysophosphatidic acid receptor 6-like [Spea bombifrons]|uniref:lysophosphatidic acid receptor 6-like n=1 Tax=Spea bombifrons TaxID=233779 RepID=UPI00234938CD|nr:lysophosphatidic acid receptor 6-like [Spea bombifrons]